MLFVFVMLFAKVSNGTETCAHLFFLGFVADYMIIHLRLFFRFHKLCIMGKIARTLLALMFLFAVTGANAATAPDTTEGTASFNWEKVMNAIIQVESGGNPNARSGASVGAMQITPILVRGCNEILKSRKSSKRYTLSDRLSVSKSKEMFLLIQSHLNPKNDVEKAIRSWNGGPHYSVRATQRYYEKVMKAMARL